VASIPQEVVIKSQQFKNKLQSRAAIGLIGLRHVGLALAFLRNEQHFPVTEFDVASRGSISCQLIPETTTQIRGSRVPCRLF
jgi:UDP-N-acetyl-D-mannosaminuronate dehydrogenase